MKNYYAHIPINSNGYHEIHTEECSHLPDVENRIYLGQFPNCKYAIVEAHKYFERVNGCSFCISLCYKEGRI